MNDQRNINESNISSEYFPTMKEKQEILANEIDNDILFERYEQWDCNSDPKQILEFYIGEYDMDIEYAIEQWNDFYGANLELKTLTALAIINIVAKYYCRVCEQSGVNIGCDGKCGWYFHKRCIKIKKDSKGRRMYAKCKECLKSKK